MKNEKPMKSGKTDEEWNSCLRTGKGEEQEIP